MTEWNDLLLDKTSAMPLHEQLRQALLKAITSGRIPPGSKMPTEEELCTALGISRPVARQAYNALIEAGYVERMRGRGTFVRLPDTRGRFIDKQLSFAQEMDILGLPHRTVLLQQEWAGYTPELFSQLALKPEQRCRHIVRMRYVAEKPFVLVENYIPEPLFPGIDRYDFAQRSLYEVFRQEYGLHVARAKRTIAAQLATAEQAALLETRRGAPVLYVQNASMDQHGRFIDLSKEYLNGYSKKFEFDVVNT